MFHNTHDHQLAPLPPSAPMHQDGLKGLPFYVSGFAWAVTYFVMWTVSAPSTVAVSMATGVAGLSGCITAILEARSRAKKRAAEEKRVRRRAREEAAAKLDAPKRSRSRQPGAKR